MKKLSITIFTVFLPLLLMAQQELSWKIQHPKSKKWIALGKKGSVQEALISAGELPDPYVGKNEELFSWIEDFNWEFQSEFTLTEKELTENIDLEFPSVDTYAKIYLNGVLLGETTNAYVAFRYAIRSMAKVGKNEVKVVFQSPVSFQKNKIGALGTVLPAPNDVGKIKVAPHCRKPQYQFGWDWSLRMTTMGFWVPAKVIIYERNRMIGKGITTLSLNDKKAKQKFTIQLRNDLSDTLIWESLLFGKQEVVVANKEVERIVDIQNPVLWWPRGQGAQHLYEDKWVLKTKSGIILASEIVKFGVRLSELVQEKDQWGTSYVIKINGRAVFCKGADYIPDDIFPARITKEKLLKTVYTMADCNFNMVRVWGGGFYPSEDFFNACDESGIMVWQDFMFACAMYPGTDAFVSNLQQELDQQILRIAAHPSVVLFNGNNEVDVAWKNWGFQKTYGLNTKNQELIQQYYDRVFKDVIPKSVHRLSTIPYVHTSPLSNWGKDEYFNHGTQHYWGVWHGKDPIEDFGRKTGRFNSEYGFQSFPEFSTLLSFAPQSEWELDSPIMKHHQKSYVGNGMIAKHANILYGKTADFERFIYHSQLTQATAVSMAIVGHRTNFPRCTGTIYWQLNDCWPAPTWSSIDYFGNWKALQYTVREDYRDVAIVEKVDTIGSPTYYFISDTPVGFSCEISAKVYSLKGELLETLHCKQSVLRPYAVPLFQTELAHLKKTDFFIEFNWNDAAGNQLNRGFAHTKKMLNVTAQKSATAIVTNISGVNHEGELTVTVSEFIQDLWISSMANGVHFDQNFLDLLPGIYTFKFSFDTLPTEKEFKLFWH